MRGFEPSGIDGGTNQERGAMNKMRLMLIALTIAIPSSQFLLRAQQPAQGAPAGQGGGGQARGPAAPPQPMSFFVSSAGSGKGADLGGLAGADAICQRLA